MFLQVTITLLDTVCRHRSHGGATTASTRPPSQQLEHLEEPTSPIQPPPDLLAAGVPGAAPPCNAHSLEGGLGEREGRRQQVAGVGGGEG